MHSFPARALASLVLAVPFSVASRLLADRSPDSSWAGALWALALLGFVLGAGVAAAQGSDGPGAHHVADSSSSCCIQATRWSRGTSTCSPEIGRAHV